MLAVAETIKDIIKKKNMSQVELAEKLGMSKQNINNKFKRNTFSPDELVSIANLLNMQLAFIDGKDIYIIESSDKSSSTPKEELPSRLPMPGK